MNIRLGRGVNLRGRDGIVLPLFKGFSRQDLGAGPFAELVKALKRRDFRGRVGDRLVFYSSGMDRLVACIGAGDSRSLGDTRKTARLAMGLILDHKLRTPLIHFVRPGRLDREALVNFIDFLYLNHYRFDGYIGPDRRAKPVKDIVLDLPKIRGVDAALMAERAMVDGCVDRVRRLIDEPPSRVNPDTLVDTFREAARETGLRIETKREPELREANLQGLLAVGRASPFSPALIQISHRPERSVRTVAVVGKGITFDSGGLNVKVGNTMGEMKCDMAGAATVLGIVTAAARLDLPVRVEGFAAVAENMPGQRAYKPGDIITFKNGKSVEVVNTDAEGRLVLADALIEAAGRKPDMIVEFSTLTGAIVTALGDMLAGVMGEPQTFVRGLLRAGESTGERLWNLPLLPEYRESIQSKVADLKNADYRGASSIKAGLFLKSFTDDVPFAHVDIAGTAFLSRPNPYHSREGATGFGVRLILEFLRDLQEKSR